MAEASDSRSAPSAQRQIPQLPVPYAAAPSGVVGPGRRNLLGALAVAPLAVVAPASAYGIGEAALAMELTEEQFEEIDGLDLALFRLAQTAMRISGGRA